MLELRQKDGTAFNSGDYEIVLPKPIMMREGDTAEISKVIVDTQAETDRLIHIEEDIVLNLENYCYWTNTNATPVNKLDPTKKNNDGANYFITTRQPSGTYQNIVHITSITFFCDPKAGQEGFVRWGQKEHEQVKLDITNGLNQFETILITIPSTPVLRNDRVDVACSFLIDGSVEGRRSLEVNRNPDDKNWAFDNCVDFEINEFDTNFVSDILTPTSFISHVTIPQANYIPGDLCKKINDALTVNKATQYFTDTELIVSNFLKVSNDFQGDNDKYFVKEDGSEVLTLSLGYLFGASQVQLSFDETTSLFYWEILHSPMYAGNTVSTQIVKDEGLGSTQRLYLNSRNGGICWKSLSARKLTSDRSKTDYDFWDKKLGFDVKKLCLQPIAGKGKITNTVGNIIYHYLELEMFDGINTTNAFSSLDNVVDKLKYQTLPVAPYVATTSTLFSSCFASSPRLQELALSSGYFLIEIDGCFPSEMVGQNSITKNITGIVNRFYSVGAYTIASGDASMVYTHKGLPKYFSSFKVRILTPEKKLAEVGDDNTVFIQINNNTLQAKQTS